MCGMHETTAWQPRQSVEPFRALIQPTRLAVEGLPTYKTVFWRTYPHSFTDQSDYSDTTICVWHWMSAGDHMPLEFLMHLIPPTTLVLSCQHMTDCRDTSISEQESTQHIRLSNDIQLIHTIWNTHTLYQTEGVDADPTTTTTSRTSKINCSKNHGLSSRGRGSIYDESTGRCARTTYHTVSTTTPIIRR